MGRVMRQWKFAGSFFDAAVDGEDQSAIEGGDTNIQTICEEHSARYNGTVGT